VIPISSIFPNYADVLALEPEDLGGVILRHINSLELQERQNLNLNRYRLTNEERPVEGYPREKWNEVSRALAEAWSWLEREGLIVANPNNDRDSVFVSRRGQAIRSAEDLQKYRAASLLPKQLVHPRILENVYSLFIKGDYDTAIFRAFKEVEVSVRSAAGLPAQKIGRDLMLTAFHSDTGALTEMKDVRSEREALQWLFAGAIGVCKNPSSHRDVVLGTAETVELLLFATYLMRIVDMRSASRDGHSLKHS
jgi:uncharacterized protein (TIGR02391 family)